jgi:hypothetical protein
MCDTYREDKDWDFGTGAGFYLNADKEPYSKHYNMYDHIVMEIPKLLESKGLDIVSFPSFDVRQSILFTSPYVGWNPSVVDGSFDGW